MTLSQLQDEIGNWNGVALPNATQENIIDRLCDSVNGIYPDCSDEELADAAIYLMTLAQCRGVDLEKAVWEKHEMNKKQTRGE